MSASTLPVWVSVLSALLTPVIAGVTVYIACQQWRTNRNKLKLDLFDRRYAYYEAAKEFAARIAGDANVSAEVLCEFLRKTRGAKFIVGEDIATYFDKKLHSNGIRLNLLVTELDDVSVGPQHSAKVGERCELTEWFNDQQDVLDELFKSLLNLKH